MRGRQKELLLNGRCVAAQKGYSRKFDIYEKGKYVAVILDCSEQRQGDASMSKAEPEHIRGTMILRNTADSAFPLAEHFSFERHGKSAQKT